jgi:ubiquinone/menaquinone biosynthesis C-methylase UbiE
MLTTISGKVRRFRTRLLMRSALSAGILYRILSRNMGNRFGNRAEGWDQMVGEHAHKWFDPLDAALDHVRGTWSPARVLDIGGGTGRAGFHLAQRYPDAAVTVVDIAPRMLAFGTSRQQREQLPAISFVAGDSTAIPIADSSVDLAFILNAPFNPPEMARVLRPGGVAILAFTYAHHTPMYLDERTSRNALERAGFEHIQSGLAGEGSWVMGTLEAG